MRRPLPHPPPRAGHAGERDRGRRSWLTALLAPLAGLAWAYLPAAPLVAEVTAATTPSAAGRPGLSWLHTAGGHIVDAAGRTVLLRGFNADALLEPGARHADLDERDAALIQASGFDVVRLPVAWGLIEPRRGAVDSGYLDRVAATVALLERHSIYTVLDMHILDWSAGYSGSGAPAWATAPGVLDTGWAPWRLLRTHLNPAQNSATTYFWLSPDWQADFDLAWRALALRFRDDSGVAGYDLYNEPHPLPIPPRIFERDYMWPLYQRTIEAVGAVDAAHLFIVEGTFFGNFGTAVRPLAAPDLVYSPHLYTGSLVPPAFDDGDPGPIRRRVAEQVAEAARVPAVLWNGELGIDRSTARSAEWADAALDAFDDAGIGWAWWQWRESRQWGIRDAGGGFVDLAYLRHLARPYLVAAPPGVGAGRGDGLHGRLTLRVEPGHGAGEVEVGWSSVTLTPPRVSGSCVAGASDDPGAGRLVLRLVPGAGCEVVLGAVAG